jgi:hypothetical protein
MNNPMDADCRDIPHRMPIENNMQKGIGINTAKLKQEAAELKEIASELMVSEIPDTYAIESAISNTAEAAKGADGITLLILQEHLKKLCDLQIVQLSK